jgi:cytochrome c-type biogenesis protein CcmH
VFIFAQAAQGPRMPLAIVRKQVQSLPATVSLADSMAMTPAMRLSQFRQVIVGARISKSGNATPQAGDLEGYNDTITLGTTKSLSVNINRVVP